MKVLLIAALFAFPLLQQEEDTAEVRAQKSAEQWLALVDAGDYGGSWTQAARFFNRH